MKSFIRSFAISGWFVMIRFMGRLCGTPLVGATFTYLSLGAAVAPLAGFYGGTVGSLGAGFLTLLVVTLLHGSLSLASLVLYVPGIVGGLFFGNSSRLLKSFFFVASMVLFWCNPVGQQAFLYPLLWIVPLLLVLIDQQSLFARAVVSSFAVHAVGACWWLYTMPMNPVLWHSMMPLVVVERLIQALLMVIVVKVVAALSCFIKARQIAASIPI